MTSYGPETADLFDYLKHVSYVIRTRGWISRASARESGEVATANLVAEAMAHMRVCYAPLSPHAVFGCSNWHLHLHPTGEDEEIAERAMAWARALPPSSGEYLDHIHAVCQSQAFDVRDMALVASLIPSYERAVARLREQRLVAAESQHVGVVNSRIDLDHVTILRVSHIEGDYGVSTLYKMVDGSGNRLFWRASPNSSVSLQEGHRYAITGTIKKHEFYQGAAETTLTRVKLRFEEDVTDEGNEPARTRETA